MIAAGTPPTQATLRAASTTACRPQVGIDAAVARVAIHGERQPRRAARHRDHDAGIGLAGLERRVRLDLAVVVLEERPPAAEVRRRPTVRGGLAEVAITSLERGFLSLRLAGASAARS